MGTDGEQLTANVSGQDAAELAMIDENLCRAELSPSERARQTARRKAIYEEKHPETAVGVSQALGMNRAIGNDVGAKSAPTFTEATSAAIGRSERAVQRDAERGEKVIPEVLDRIRATKLSALSIPPRPLRLVLFVQHRFVYVLY